MGIELLNATQLAHRLGVRPSTVQRWHRAGLIPSTRLTAKVIRFDLEAVIAALSARSREGGGR